MGKRELVIVIAFVALGVMAYWWTAPPPKEGERAFSITQIFSGIRREISANAASATINKTGTIPVGAGVTELQVRTLRRVPLVVTGEARTDIAYEFPVESSGPDEATAKEWAGQTEVRQDDLGTALSLWVFFPSEGTQSAKLTLRVPAGLTVRVEGSGKVQVTGVAAVHLMNIAGEAELAQVKGAVTGNHRTGDLTVTGAGAIDLNLVSSRASLREVTGGVRLNARNGDCSVVRSQGPVDATLSNVEFDITEHEGPTKITGDGGRLKVTLPRQTVSADVRRMLVEATIGGSVPATLITSDEPLRVSIAAGASLKIDAIATDGGSIRVTDVTATPTTDGRESRLATVTGRGDARVVLRNARGDIVISQRK